MGWDCTLHVVDERSLARFVDRFLGRTSEKAPFDDAFDNAADLIAKTKQALAGPDPEAAGRTLGELAILYVSAETPHAYSRGFSLSLWDEDRMGAPMPPDGLGSVEDLLGPIVDAYPAVRKRVPSMFQQNYCVGPFIRAADVPRVLAYVEKTLAAMVPGDRTYYTVLARVLRVAAARGMAYWEGTDLGVAQAHAEWLEDERPVGGPLRIAPSAVKDQPKAVSGDRFVMYSEAETPILDVSTFPPTTQLISGYRTTMAAFTPWNTVLMSSANDFKVRPLVFSLYEVAASGGTPRPVDFILPWDLDGAYSSRDALLLFPHRYILQTHPDARPLALRGGQLTPLDLPPATGRKAVVGSFLEVVSNAVRFGDGSMFVLWDSQPYRVNGGQVTALGGDDLRTLHDPQTLVTVSDDAIVGLFRGTPVRISRDGARETILPLTNAQSIMLGRDDALIIHEDNNVEGDALKIWWPRTHEVTAVQADVFGAEDAPRFFYFASGLLVAHYKREWRALPWDAIAALPRTPEAKFLAAHEKLVAKSAARKKR